MSRRLASCRRGAVSVLFAIATIPILGFCGLAVDYGIWAEINASLATAVNVASLNAVKIAANAYINHDPNYVSEGETAGAAWFDAMENATFPKVRGGRISIAIGGNTSITATATFRNASIPRIFGRIFGSRDYYFDVQAAATIDTASYLQVVMMLDNSSSMDIAATVAGMNQLMTLSACDPTNAYYPPRDPNVPIPAGNLWTNQSRITYDNYATTAPNVSPFDGTYYAALPNNVPLDPPVAAPASVLGFPPAVPNEYPTGTLVATAGLSFFKTENFLGSNVFPYHVNATSWNTGQTCQGVLPAVRGQYPLPGPPCAFACHWTNEPVKPPPGATVADPRLGTNDLYGLARRNGIALRFDYVKSATQTVLQAMATDNNAGLNNLSVGIYTFNSTVARVYPTSNEAGSDFGTAEAAVGTQDSGIPAVIGGLTGDNDDTAFPEDMKTLASTYVTAAGDGTTAAAPRKVLFLVTDGFQDDPNLYRTPHERQAFDPTDPTTCQHFKDPVSQGGLGYQVYVVYTPYYPVPHYAYLTNHWANIVQQNGPGAAPGSGSIPYNLRACSSYSPNDPPGTSYFISAVSQGDIKAALLKFLAQALKTPARYTE